ncbi:hypothetical protein Tdes44962_MAKER08286 [Teratosphaeria destructans]|uniref:Uncharacterized protein n=1 Tax=Teratosphaeria destructans TaxID=418781 RepID=A0A9W7SXM3_9PEZI|nr:hypothetical protein Tdes44962_MAKER08286 [Teratosphaeria destructans]
MIFVPLLLAPRGKIWLSEGRVRTFGDDIEAVKNARSLAATCRKIRQETVPVFYGSNDFLWSVDGLYTLCPQGVHFEVTTFALWLRRLGATSQLVRICKIWLGNWDPSDHYQGLGGNGGLQIAHVASGFWKVVRATNVRLEVGFFLSWFSRSARLGWTDHVVIQMPFRLDAATLLHSELAAVERAICTESRTPEEQRHLDESADLSLMGLEKMLTAIKRLQDA